MYLLVHFRTALTTGIPIGAPTTATTTTPTSNRTGGTIPRLPRLYTSRSRLPEWYSGLSLLTISSIFLARDTGGHFYRYPYYGPYRSYYYKPTYRPYTGCYVSVNNVNISIATVHARQGDSRWDALAYAVGRSAPFTRSAPWQRAPEQQQQRQPAPACRPQQPRPTSQQPEWQPQPRPTSQPQRQATPANQNDGLGSPHGRAPRFGAAVPRRR